MKKVADREFIERRKGPDLWVRSLRWFAVIGWMLMIGVLIIVEIAKPKLETMFDRLYDVKLRTTWDENVAIWIFYFMIAGLFISGIGLLVTTKRNRRRSDKYPVSLLLIGGISLLGIVIKVLLY